MDGLGDEVMNIGFWVMLPVFRLSEKSRHKAVRVLGALSVFPLCPLILIGAPIVFIGVMIDIYETI